MSKSPTTRGTKSGTKPTLPTTAGKRKRSKSPKIPPKCAEETGIGDIEDLLKFSEEEVAEIRASLLEWYDENKRDLPWRRLNADDGDIKAYGVWVSEVMLQQTRVATVIDYYNRWMQKWPSLYHLSLASLEEVNDMWAGLGYYRRARYLLEGAKKIVEEGTGFPRTVTALRKVPGIGDYTAGAIASIAFTEAVPVVDGNVVRVLARLKAISANPKDSATIKKFWRLAGQLVDPCRPGDFNQALMELGATICTPTNPSCSKCPVSLQCHALSLSQQGGLTQVTDFPQKAVKVKQRNEYSAVCVVEISESRDLLDGNPANSKYLLVKRPDEGLLAGLWEFPSVLLGQEAEMAVRREAIDDFLRTTFSLDTKKTCKVILRDNVGDYLHIFSHIRLKMYVELLVINMKGGLNLQQNGLLEGSMVWKCVDSKELSSMGLTSGVRKSTTDSCSNNINLNDIINFDTTAMTCEVVWNPHGYILRHAQAATDVWSFLLSAPYRNNWIGMGFSKNGLMIGSSAMVGWVNPNGTGTGLQYLLKDQDPNKVVPNQGELKLVENTTTVIRQGNLVYLAFQLNAPQPLIEVLYAVGPNGKLPNDKNGLKLTQHQDRVSTTLNYATGKSQTQSSPYAGLRKTHGALNMLGWGILMPIGAIVARYFKEWDPIWYYSHAAIQGLGWLFGLVGFILGFVTQGFIHAQVEHHKNLGITILVVGCLQVTALLLRPQKGSKFRKYWNWYHHNAGRILVILAISNIFYGIHLGMEGPSWYGTYAVILVILVIAAIAMEIRSWRQR